MPTRATVGKPEAEAEAHRVMSHPLVRGTPAEIDAYIDARAGSPAQLRSMIRTLAKAVAHMAKTRRQVP